VNGSQIPEFVWHFTKQNGRRRSLAVIIFEKILKMPNRDVFLTLTEIAFLLPNGK
jgi:hypothetical protein